MTVPFKNLVCPIEKCQFVARDRALIKRHEKIYRHIENDHTSGVAQFPMGFKLTCPLDSCDVSFTSFNQHYVTERMLAHVKTAHRK